MIKIKVKIEYDNNGNPRITEFEGKWDDFNKVSVCYFASKKNR